MIHIILPIYNEEATIEKTLHTSLLWCKKHLNNEFKIIFVNDHSTDTTVKKITNLKLNNVRVISNLYEGGKGSALKFAFTRLSFEMQDDDYVVFMDGDGQIEISDILTFLRIMNLYNADVVIGNKRHDYSITEYSIERMIVSKTYNFLIRAMFGFNLRDTQCGLKLFKKPALDLVIDKITTRRFAFDLELLVAIRGVRLRVVDAPVTVNPQVNKGSVSFNSIKDTFLDTLSIFIRYKKRFYY